MQNNSTLWLLLGMYEGKFHITVEEVVRNHFPHLDAVKFLRKVADGAIQLPVMSAENSQRSARMVDLRDLADYLDQRRQDARDRLAKLHS